MADDNENYDDDATTFVEDSVREIIVSSIQDTVAGHPYDTAKVKGWTSGIIETTLNKLCALNKPFKYIVTCVVMQKTGVGLHTARSCFWDNSTDGSCTVKWDSKHMHVIVTVFGVAI
eukprot:m.12964 g.12964  ORF g.12964 m.12964 type:complete len:117 (-) comp7138_c0_seq1:35-385(-)